MELFKGKKKNHQKSRKKSGVKKIWGKKKVGLKKNIQKVEETAGTKKKWG